jgi:putative lipoic acid-binding regulatory protein|tara:strand:+ start:35 stop:295 length:261 start_codon:yes stop_codon:yes gene_type:complete
VTDPKIIFPCDYPIKVVGDVTPEFHSQVCDVVAKHDPAMTTDKISQKTSRKGNFVSISFMLVAQNKEHLDALFADLKEIEAVRLVL